jgi:Asp-tRNA(Asn)/Glu-tRNA(Gln) amidotransferase A subunit family amidase
VELGRLLKSRKVTSVALTHMYLRRLKHYGPRLNCVITLCEDHALKQAAKADAEIAAGHYRGPLHGIPFGAKDLLATHGIRTTYGAKPYIDQMLDYDATVIHRLNEAGAVLVAKLSMGELAMGDVWYGGVTRNPWDSHIGSSGSSAGSASATAAGLVGFSIGTETLGSIVSPSVRCGATGLRPTFGRVSRHGAMAVSWTMDKIGPICRGVEDCALVLHAIQGPDGQDHTVIDAPLSWNGGKSLSALRIGIDHAAFEALKTGRYRSGGPNMQPDPARQKVYKAALETLESLGAKFIPIEMPSIDPIREGIADMVISAESAAVFQHLNVSGKLDLLAQQGEESWPTTYRVGSTIPAADYLQALRYRRLLQQEMARAVAHVDAYVTVPFMGPSLMVTNLTGHPTLVTRCGMIGNTPQSIEFIGGLYREDAILRIAYAFEQATSWHKHWPEVDRLPETPPEMKRGR